MRSYLLVVVILLTATGIYSGLPLLPASLKNIIKLLGFENITMVIIQSTIVWNKTPCSLLEVNRRFGENITSIFSVKYAEQRKSAWTLVANLLTFNGIEGLM
jgi:hypothetical protein